MARRKKSGSKGLFGIIPVVVIVLAVYALLLHTPSSATVAEKIDAKTDISAEQNDTVDYILSQFGGLFSDTAPESIVFITDSREDDDKSGLVYYYETAEKAKAATADFKEAQDEDSEDVIYKRGNAVYVGSKECLYLYLSVIY